MSFEDDVERFLTVSSNHATPNDFNLMTSSAEKSLMVFRESMDEAGVILNIGYIEGCGFDREALSALKFSDLFCNLIEWAIKNNIAWVRIDRDGTKIDGLSQCDWQ